MKIINVIVLTIMYTNAVIKVTVHESN